MSARRDLRPLLAIAVLGVVAAVLLAESIAHTDLLLLSPALVIALPLLAGRYVGAATLERLAARRAMPHRRVRAVAFAPPRRRPRASRARGGRLIAAALAERGPPPRAAAFA
ncbi:MAG TPA: hypothetical protein VI318_09445 [Baekduia sp.]